MGRADDRSDHAASVKQDQMDCGCRKYKGSQMTPDIQHDNNVGLSRIIGGMENRKVTTR